MEVVKQFLKDILLHPDFHEYFSYVLFAIVIYVLRAYLWLDRAEIKEGIKGKNGKYDNLEVVFIIWIILFTAAILGSLFFQQDMPGEAWLSLDSVGLIVLGAKKGPELLAARGSKRDNLAGKKGGGSEGMENLTDEP